MPTIAQSPERYAGRVVGNAHCVAFVREAAGLPPTSHWRAGGSVLDAEPGTAIATFDANGRYGNHTDGRSHAGILIAEGDDGLWVWDQWVGHPVARRLIQFRNGRGLRCDDGDAYSVIELADG